MPANPDDMALLEALGGVLREAGALATRPARAEAKAHQDWVTDVDLAVDAFLEDALGRLLPGVPVLSEERAAREDGPCDAWWVVDPIDGTGNLIAGLPFVGISVALSGGAGPRLAAVLGLPGGPLYEARRGGGARRDGVPLRLPAAPSALVGLSTGLLDALVEAPDAFARWKALRSVGKIRNLGAQSLQLCAVAEGALAAAASIEARVWDEAAGGLVLREAGALWRSAADEADWSRPAALMASGPQRSLACHPACRAEMEQALAGIVAGP
jgi:myo-inositol-1(or 4)-monophosphatase